MPSRRATMVRPAVPRHRRLHAGAHQRAHRRGSSGTAWRCMLEPISARLASSFSRNGISAAATDTSCFGDTSIAVTSSGLTSRKSPCRRTETRSWVNRPSVVHRRIRLGDDELLLLHRREIAGLLLHHPVLHQHVRRLDEAVFVHLRKGRQRVDQPDVGPFRRLDRADAPVMRRVHVAHLETGPLARQTARPRGRTGGACASPPTAGWSGP